SKSVATANDHARSAFVATGLLTLRIPAPRAHWVRITLAGLALATAVRMVDRVHHDTAHRRTNAAPTNRTGLAVAAQAVLFVAHLADRRAAIDVHLAHFGRAQADRRVRAFAGRKLCGAAGAARQLAALAGFQL